jgi:hypothetical protein
MEQTRDFMIITYNEGRKDYSKKNLFTLINDIFIKNPLLIFVCTQEASSGNIHFQKRLQKRLNEIHPYKYNLLLKFSNIRIGIPGNKNVKTYVYYDINRCYLANNYKKYTYHKPIFTSHVTEKIGSMKKLNKNPINIYENTTYKPKHHSSHPTSNSLFEITGYGIYNSKYSGLGTITDMTLFKGAIYIRVEIMINGKLVKIIVANSHLFFKGDIKTGLSKREEQFLSIISEFNFAKKLQEGYNIFFCGDLNFRFIDTITQEASLSFSEKMLRILREENRIMSNSFHKYSIKNELYDYLERLKNETNNGYNNVIEIINKFKESLDSVGFPITCRVIEGKNRIIYSNNNIGKIKEKENKYKCIESSKNPDTNKAIFRCHKHIYLTPSNCDKILFALNDVSRTIKPIKKNNLILYPTVDLSDHYAMSLSGDFIR